MLAPLLLGMVLPLEAQRRFRGGGFEGGIEANVPYDGRFTFARIRYTVYGRSGWEFDYPAMERNLMKVMEEITALRPHVQGSNIHTFDDPELLKYPVAYVSEPGYWIPSESEVLGLRTYLAKGGFVIFDDFMGYEWRNFETQIRRALPQARIVPMDVSHPIFDSFFHIESLDMTYPNNPRIKAEFFGIYEDNDPEKRLMAIINYNNDIGDYMEWSGSGWLPVNLTNDAYKLAVNYIIYGLTR
jgi:hypothetical protein